MKAKAWIAERLHRLIDRLYYEPTIREGNVTYQGSDSGDPRIVIEWPQGGHISFGERDRDFQDMVRRFGPPIITRRGMF